MKKVMIGILILIPIIVLVVVALVSVIVSVNAHIAVEDLQLRYKVPTRRSTLFKSPSTRLQT